MNNLSTYIIEKLKINKNTSIKKYNFFPEDKGEFMQIIEKYQERNIDKISEIEGDLDSMKMIVKDTIQKTVDNTLNLEDLEKRSQVLKERGKDANLNDIDTSKITDMSFLFVGNDIRNIDISEWDTSNVEDMTEMFLECSKFTSDLSAWDVSKVRFMNKMFKGCYTFNSDLSNWNVSSCIGMPAIFRDCWEFNSDLSKWDVSKVTNLSNAFKRTKKFNSDLSKWDTSSCIMHEGIFDESAIQKKNMCKFKC